jgi:prephenate dehydrogenase
LESSVSETKLLKGACRLRVAIIGTGLIGASLGLALQELLEVETVVGYDRDADRLATALNRGAMASVGLDASDAVRDADVVVLAVPASAMAAIAGEIAGSLETGTIVTDVASVKTGVVSTLQQLLPDDVWLVGGHPMAGSHEEGPEHASADLFVGATYLLTPTTHTDPEAYRTLHRLFAGIGARPMAVNPIDHDRLVAVISHLPQLAATTLMNLASEQACCCWRQAVSVTPPGSLRATRICGSTSAQRTATRSLRCSTTTRPGSNSYGRPWRLRTTQNCTTRCWRPSARDGRCRASPCGAVR